MFKRGETRKTNKIPGGGEGRKEDISINETKGNHLGDFLGGKKTAVLSTKWDEEGSLKRAEYIQGVRESNNCLPRRKTS